MNLLIGGFGGAVALLLIAGAVLQLSGWPTAIGPGADLPSTASWANLALGVSLALFSLSRIPHDHRILWDDILFPPMLGCLLGGAYLFWRSRRTE